MRTRAVAAPDAPAAAGAYAQAPEVAGASRLLFVSGQVPVAPDGSLPEGFAAQCRQAGASLEAQLRAAGMGLDHLIEVTILPADRAHPAENRAVQQAVLGDPPPALTAIVAAIFGAEWLLAIEAVAAA